MTKQKLPSPNSKAAVESRGERSVYAVHGLWWEDGHIHLTVAGSHVSVYPDNPIFYIYLRLLQEHGRGPGTGDPDRGRKSRLT